MESKDKIIPLTDNYITCQLRGRTGNVMFELAHGYAKALKYNRQFIAPLENTEEALKNTLFRKLDFHRLDISDSTIIHAPFNYVELEPHNNTPTVFNGYYQSEKYFEGFTEAIRSLYHPPPEFIEKAITEYPFLNASTVAAINVRRGDYLTQPSYHPVVDITYINEAYKQLPPHDILLIMSDDIEWCKENIKLPNMVFNDNTKFWNQEGIWLLSLCDHFIISNSTFSWWGAWLSNSKNKVVIAPDTWFGPDITENVEDLYCSNWIKVPTVYDNGTITVKKLNTNVYYDYLIVGAGFYGAICARELTDAGYKVLVIDQRKHIGGNCYTENRDDINLHIYGPHIFHTSNEEVWKWINRYTEFNSFRYSPVANYKNETYSLPFSMWTFSKLWNITLPAEAESIIKEQSSKVDVPTNLEEQAIKLVGTDVYEKLIKGYTAKQWKKDPKLLPKEIIQRLPVRLTYDSNYFNDKYQGIPTKGYTEIFKTLLEGIDVRLDFNFFTSELDFEYKKLIYTGPIDTFYRYQFGDLEYKTTRFEHKHHDLENLQGVAVVNYTDENVEYTRTIEHKHFEFGKQPTTWVTTEYPTEYIPKVTEPMYPVNDAENNTRYLKYKALADQENDVIFGGRLAEYKYYDMHQVIASALEAVKKEIENNVSKYL